MKNLWKYLSTLGLIFVAFLCLGVGLKASSVSFAAPATGESTLNPAGSTTACVYIANGKHEMSGGTLSGKDYGVYIAGGTFTMNGGTIKNAASDGVYINGGTFNLNGGSITNSGNCGIYLISGIFNYTAADDVESIGLASGQYITLKKAPTHTLYIENSTIVGTKIAKLDGFTSLTATQLSYLHTDLESNTRLEVQYIDGAYWVVISDRVNVTFVSDPVGAVTQLSYWGSGKDPTSVVKAKIGSTVKYNLFHTMAVGLQFSSADYASVFLSLQTDGKTLSSNDKYEYAGFYINGTQLTTSGVTLNDDVTITIKLKQVKATITFGTPYTVLDATKGHFSTSSSTTYSSASMVYNIDVDLNTSISLYQSKVVVGSTTIYITYASGESYTNVNVSNLGKLQPGLFSSSSVYNYTVTQDVTIIYYATKKSFLAQGEEGEAPPEIQWGIEVVMRDEDKIMTKPTLYIMPSDSEIIVRRRVK